MKLLRKRSPRPSEMTVVEHLTEFRSRLVVMMIAVGIGALIGWFLFEPFLDLLREPFCQAIQQMPADLQPPTGCDLVFNGPVEPFVLKLKVVFFLGIGLALPVLLWEFWAFITPGLTQREKRWSVPFVFASVALFLAGAAFAFFTLPTGLKFLLSFAGPGFVPLLTATRYIGFFMLMVMAFGVAFELPIVLIFLTAVGVITTRQLRSWRRYAVVGIFIIAAVVTPSQDPLTLLAMAIPMYLLYEVAIIVGRIMRK